MRRVLPSTIASDCQLLPRDPQSAAAASGRASVRAAARHACAAPIRIGDQLRSTRRPARSPVKSRSSITTAAPARANTSAFFRWWSSVAVGSGTRIAGVPDAASSARVVAPARQMTTSAAFISPSIWKMKASTRAASPARWYAARTRSRSRSPVWWVIARRIPEAASRDAASTMATLIACAP